MDFTIIYAPLKISFDIRLSGATSISGAKDKIRKQVTQEVLKVEELQLYSGAEFKQELENSKTVGDYFKTGTILYLRKQPLPSIDRWNLVFTTFAQKDVTVLACGDLLVRSVKSKLRDLTGISVDNQCLFVNGVAMNDPDMTLDEYGVDADSKLVCMDQAAFLQSNGSVLVSATAYNLLSDLLKTGFESDLVVVSKDGHKFPVHKAVVCLRSEVFKTMLGSDFKEGQSGVIQFPEEKALTEVFLELVYMGDSQRTVEWAEHLVELGEKYQMVDIKEKAIRVIRLAVEIESAARLLGFADFRGLAELKDYIVRFIQRNPKVYSSDGWRNLSEENPKLALWAVNKINGSPPA